MCEGSPAHLHKRDHHYHKYTHHYTTKLSCFQAYYLSIFFSESSTIDYSFEWGRLVIVWVYFYILLNVATYVQKFYVFFFWFYSKIEFFFNTKIFDKIHYYTTRLILFLIGNSPQEIITNSFNNPEMQLNEDSNQPYDCGIYFLIS